MRRNIFKSVMNHRPSRSMFDLSYEKKFSGDMGKLYPVLCEEVVPGDFIKIGNQCVIRFQPLVAPVLHEINVYVHYFFVPYRLLWPNNDAMTDGWETFITGGVDGEQTPTLPVWDVTDDTVGSLWDYLGFPVDVDPGAGARPVDFPRRAYARIFNEYYRDETLQTEVAATNEDILIRNWEKDYLTSAATDLQRGTSPALPLYGDVPVTGLGTDTNVWSNGPVSVYETDGTAPVNYSKYKITYASTDQSMVVEEDPTNAGYPNIRAELSSGVSVDINDLRLAVQTQKFLERNMRTGVRYTEFLQAHYNCSPRDDRLNRSEYIGGSKSPVIISEVLQTSSTDGTSPQGNLAGHGISASNAYCGKYHVQEFGLIMGIMSVMPRTAYSQGINRQWLKTTKYDYFLPEFVNLSEQPIYNAEVCALDGDPTHNLEIFGYQGRYDELRTKSSMICGDLRSTFDYWHLGREFNPASPPELNEDFIQCIPRKDIFAAPSEDGLIISFGNVIHAYRPLPVQAIPGLMDHN